VVHAPGEVFKKSVITLILKTLSFTGEAGVVMVPENEDFALAGDKTVSPVSLKSPSPL
jgi:hypothetical protein